MRADPADAQPWGDVCRELFRPLGLIEIRMRKFHLTNAAGRDATVNLVGLKPTDPPRPGRADRSIEFYRYLSTSEAGLHPALQARYGEDYGDALVNGDPEIDMEVVGRRVGRTDRVYLSNSGEVLYAPPKVVEILFDTSGEEKAQRPPEDVEANVNDERPVRWTGRKMRRDDVVRRFVFRRTVQIQHVDGLSYDYLFAIAQELAETDEMVMLGGGDGGKKPLIFQTNGTPYRGFLEGRVDGSKYQLLLHLSNMELKRPDAKEA